MTSAVSLVQELSRNRLRDLSPEALVVLPVGATEQHGPHLPVGTDFLVVERVARAAAERAATEIPVLIAPTLPYGSSHHHLPWSGTLSLSTDSFFKAAHDLVLSLAGGGFRRIFILNGHGGNDELVQVVARDVALQEPVDVAAASYWNIAWDALVEAGAAVGSLPGHAGAFETALMLAIAPELVDPERPDRPWDPQSDDQGGRYRVESHGSWKETDGFTDNPARGVAADGERYFEAIVGAVGAALIDFYRSSASAATT
jgi:creatinine amidohydrolase